MRKFLVYFPVLILFAAGAIAAQETPAQSNGQGGHGEIPVVLQQWTKDVKQVEKSYGSYAFLNANLNRTFALSGKLPPGEINELARFMVELHKSAISLEHSRQRVDKTEIPSRYIGAVNTWKIRIRQIHADMSKEECGYCDIPAESPSGDVPAITSCTEKVGAACVIGECLDCCESIPDANRQSLCGLRCQYHASLCVLGGIAGRP